MMHLSECGKSTITPSAEQTDGSGGHTTPQRIKAADLRVVSSNKNGVGHKQLLELLERQGYRCALTGEELTPSTASLDHCVPVSRGGTHGIDNVQIVTQKVNAAKNTMTNEEFIAVCRAVASHCES
jgi:5-methylcytosine-specific restriction endonuclease McrA